MAARKVRTRPVVVLRRIEKQSFVQLQDDPDQKVAGAGLGKGGLWFAYPLTARDCKPIGRSDPLCDTVASRGTFCEPQGRGKRMRITALKITNFKALKNLEIASIGDIVVLAGPNGCGKTCVLDAIRLLKSAYGGYITNETQSWLNEFNVAYKPGHIDAAPLLHDRNLSLSIEAHFTLTREEVSFLQGDITELVRDMAVNESPDAPFQKFRTFQSLAHQARHSEPAIQSASRRIREEIEAELNFGSLIGRLTIQPEGTYQLEQCRLLELIFSTFKPSQIGVLDFQNSSRHYKREPSGSIQITIDQTVDQMSAKARNHSLYNHEQRYSNLKQELATAYVKALISGKAGGQDAGQAKSLTETLRDLFTTFIPGKNFGGPQADLNGTLMFDVTTSAGGRHDINDLSSGEKEVLYGYLLLSNRAPKNSILMIDEPELHLNPRLVEDLPAFYGRHLGRALGNQIWLVTHSDAIVRGAISTQGASVFHLQPAETTAEVNQATGVLGDTEMRALVLSLVGDLAAFRPAAPIVILEGGGESEDASVFDTHAVARLFPEFSKRVNCVSGHDKKHVHHLHDALVKAKASGLIAQDVYSLVDQDDDAASSPLANSGRFVWDRYHIENFLLEARFVREALVELCADKAPFTSDDEVEDALRQCAEESTAKIVSHRVLNWVRSSIVEAVKIGCDPSAADLRCALTPSIDSTRSRLDGLWTTGLSTDSLDQRISNVTDEVRAALGNGEWRSKLPGRPILKAFAAKYASNGGSGIAYLTLRNSILGRMAAAKYKPAGMQDTLRKIVTTL